MNPKIVSETTTASKAAKRTARPPHKPYIVTDAFREGRPPEFMLGLGKVTAVARRIWNDDDARALKSNEAYQAGKGFDHNAFLASYYDAGRVIEDAIRDALTFDGATFSGFCAGLAGLVVDSFGTFNRGNDIDAVARYQRALYAGRRHSDTTSDAASQADQTASSGEADLRSSLQLIDCLTDEACTNIRSLALTARRSIDCNPDSLCDVANVLDIIWQTADGLANDVNVEAEEKGANYRAPEDTVHRRIYDSWRKMRKDAREEQNRLGREAFKVADEPVDCDNTEDEERMELAWQATCKVQPLIDALQEHAPADPKVRAVVHDLTELVGVMCSALTDEADAPSDIRARLDKVTTFKS